MAWSPWQFLISLALNRGSPRHPMQKALTADDGVSLVLFMAWPCCTCFKPSDYFIDGVGNLAPDPDTTLWPFP